MRYSHQTFATFVLAVSWCGIFCSTSPKMLLGLSRALGDWQYVTGELSVSCIETRLMPATTKQNGLTHGSFKQNCLSVFWTTHIIPLYWNTPRPEKLFRNDNWREIGGISINLVRAFGSQCDCILFGCLLVSGLVGWLVGRAIGWGLSLYVLVMALVVLIAWVETW